VSKRSGIDRAALVAACAGVLGTAAVRAQEPVAEGVTEVVVTGSRIKQNEFDAPTPTVAISAEALDRAGTTNLTDFLRTMPALVGSEDAVRNTYSEGYIGSTGLNLLDLRNLGAQRTLVLVDGRRHVSQVAGTAAVDVNTIPQDLIERVDIVTGGVSAVYGADAVSGVVNFVMKKDFEGLIGRVQYGAADADPSNVRASLTGGFNFADGRGNLSGSIQYSNEGRLKSSERSYLRGRNYTTLQRNPDDPDDDPSVPDYVPLNDVRFVDSAPAGAIDVDHDWVPDVLPDGSPFRVDRFVAPYFSQGGSGTPLSDYIGDVLPKVQTSVASLFGNFSVSDAVNLFGEAKVVRGKAFSSGQPTFDFGLIQSVDNPFLDPAIAAMATDGYVMLNRDNFDLGVRGEDNTRNTLRFVGGVKGDVWERYNYEASYTYGQSDIKITAVNNRYNDRFYAAIDVVTDPLTGLPTCRSNLDPSALPYDSFDYAGHRLSFTPGANSGCRPLNILGDGVADPAAVDWVAFNNNTRSRLTQNVFNAFLAGPVPGITLPAGDIDAVIGVEWRREASRSTPPQEDQDGITFGNSILPSRGDFTVKEAFAELRVPVLKDLPFAELLQVSAAVRASDYSTVGSTTTWNTGVLWAPLRDVSFRGTVAEAVRAPNIGELFNPQTQSYEGIIDPCDSSQLNNGTGYRSTNCAAILSALGIDPAGYTDPNSSSVSGIQTGNSHLREETARSYTFGTVIRPRFAPGLSLAVDYYDINIKQAINTASAQEVADSCVDQPTIDNVFCNALTRKANGGIGSFVLQPENVASFRTRGIDFNLSYLLDPARLGLDADIGAFNVTVVGNRLDRLTTVPMIGAEQIDQRGTLYAPKRQIALDVTWKFHDLAVNYGLNYFSKTARYPLLTLSGNPDQASRDNLYFDARKTHDLSASYDFGGYYRVYGGINNLTDQRPDYSIIAPVNPLGRFYYAGVKVSFGGAAL